MTSYLLDTCVLSETSRPLPHPQVVSFTEKAGNLFIPAAALMEFQLGITEICSSDPIKAVRLSSWYQSLLKSRVPIIETGKDVAEIWGTLAADSRLKNLITADARAKRPRNGQDLHIAAAALFHRLPIATMNVRDFQLIDSLYPLPGIYNPLEDVWYAKPDPLKFPETPKLQSIVA